MPQVRCPRCQHFNLVSDLEIGRLVFCDKPRCGHSYVARRPPTAPVPTPPPVCRKVDLPEQTVLTGAHICPNCHGQTNQGFRLRRATVVHRPIAPADQPPAAPCRMDIYAVLYFCPGCPTQTLLETPTYQCGQEVQCPRCLVTFQAPFFDLLHEIVGDHREGTIFRFACPSCSGLLQCDTHREGKPTAGLPVACLHCFMLFEVPPHGDRVRS